MYKLNYGPHHPSTHGVLRLVLTMEGEEILGCEPIIGYLHRGVEQLVESKQFISIIPYIDRLDYLAPVISEHAYVLALEKALDIEVPKRALIIRTIFDELTRISCHIMGIGCATYDIGLMNIFLYGMEEREKIMEIFYKTTGNRMHLAYYIPGGVTKDIDNNIIKLIHLFINNLEFYLNNVEKLALDNRIFKSRTENIGIITKELAMNYGISGVNLRSTGINYDMRQVKPYGIYKELDFKPVILNKSDCYNRTVLRYLEIKQSIDLINKCLDIIQENEKDFYNTDDAQEKDSGITEDKIYSAHNKSPALNNKVTRIYKENNSNIKKSSQNNKYIKENTIFNSNDQNKTEIEYDEYSRSTTFQMSYKSPLNNYYCDKHIQQQFEENNSEANNNNYCNYIKYKRQDGSDCFKCNIKLPANTSIYSSVENSRGEFGIHLFTGNKPSNTPYRLHFKSPSFAIIQMLRELLKGVTLADVSVILGSLDFVLGDCDR